MASPVAVVVQINLVRFPFGAIPPENQPPLLVDPDGMEAIQVSAQFLEVIARGTRKS
jgi:hypothetical protein